MTAKIFRSYYAAMKNRKHPLRLWLAANGKTLQEFAAEIGASQSYLSECITQKKRPSLDFIDRIKKATDNAVSADHF